MKLHRIAATALLSGTALVLSALPASADHTHVRAVGGDGRCVILAEGSGEAYVQLPGYDHLPENRRHPLHVKVHLGEAGTRDGEPVVWVKGSPEDAANCTSYVNG
jgi:hypothetical protein